MKKNVMILLLFSVTKIMSVPIYNQYDPVQFHTVYGTDKYFYEQENNFKFSINLSPYYQHSSGARDSGGVKVPEGDMLGRWNMFGLFFGLKWVLNQTGYAEGLENASPSTKPFDLGDATNVLVADGVKGVAVPVEDTQDDYSKLSDAWRVLDDTAEADPARIDENAKYDQTYLAKNYTLESLFDLQVQREFLPITYVDYEKVGVRGRLNFECDFGLGCNLKYGFCDYEQKPYFVRGAGFTDSNIANDTNEQYYLYNYLFKPEIVELILEEVGLNIQSVHKTALEDTHFEVYFKYPLELMDEDCDTAAILIPYLSMGVWMPTGKKKDQNKFFSIPTGNDDFWGFTLDGSINIDFPHMVQIGFGLGVAFYESKRLSGFRVPDSIHQYGVYPWRARIKKRPGTLWYFNASVKTRDFLENFSFYFDFIHTQHLRDSITLQEEESSRNALFKPRKLQDDSKWRVNTVHAGLNYHVASGLELGLSVQGHISGARVYKTTTILGTISLNF